MVGVYLSLAICLLTAFLSYTTLKILTDLAHKKSIFDYIKLVESYLGRNWVITTFTLNIISNFGSMTIYIELSNFNSQSFKLYSFNIEIL